MKKSAKERGYSFLTFYSRQHNTRIRDREFLSEKETLSVGLGETAKFRKLEIEPPPFIVTHEISISEKFS